MIWKYSAATGSYMFSNAVYWGFIPSSGQTLRFYGTTGNSALEIPANTSNVVCSGNISATSKSFGIKQDWREDAPAGKERRMRHWCLESDEQGGSLIYRRQVTAPKAGIADLTMPAWFQYLTKDVMVFCNGVGHFGNAYGEVDELDPCVIHITTSRGGLFNVMVTAARKDTAALACPSDVEYMADLPTVL
jgi:hypothetical protein